MTQHFQDSGEKRNESVLSLRVEGTGLNYHLKHSLAVERKPLLCVTFPQANSCSCSSGKCLVYPLYQGNLYHWTSKGTRWLQSVHTCSFSLSRLSLSLADYSCPDRFHHALSSAHFGFIHLITLHSIFFSSLKWNQIWTLFYTYNFLINSVFSSVHPYSMSGNLNSGWGPPQ